MRTTWCAALVVFFLPWSGLASQELGLQLDAALGLNFNAASGPEFYWEATLKKGDSNLSAHAGFQGGQIQLRLSGMLAWVLGDDQLSIGLSFVKEPAVVLKAARQRPDFQLGVQGSLAPSSGWTWTVSNLWKPPGLGLGIEGQAQVLDGKLGTWNQKFHWEGEGLSFDGQVDASGWKPVQLSAERSFGDTTVGLSAQLEMPGASNVIETEFHVGQAFGDLQADAYLRVTPTSWQELRVGGARNLGFGANHVGGDLSFGPEGWQGLSLDGLFSPLGTGDLWQGRLGFGPEGFSDLLLIGTVNRSGVQLGGTVTGSPGLWMLDLSGSAKVVETQLSGKLSWMSLSGLQQFGLRAGRSFQF